MKEEAEVAHQEVLKFQEANAREQREKQTEEMEL